MLSTRTQEQLFIAKLEAGLHKLIGEIESAVQFSEEQDRLIDRLDEYVKGVDSVKQLLARGEFQAAQVLARLLGLR
jgi:hypothetical protein